MRYQRFIDVVAELACLTYWWLVLNQKGMAPGWWDCFSGRTYVRHLLAVEGRCAGGISSQDPLKHIHVARVTRLPCRSNGANFQNEIKYTIE